MLKPNIITLYGGPDDGKVVEAYGGWLIVVPHAEHLFSPMSEWWQTVYQRTEIGRADYVRTEPFG